MRMSISTTSGRVRRTTSTAARPSGASPTTRMSGSASRITRKPVRSSRWSSAMTTLIGAVAAPAGRPPRRRPRASAPARRRRAPATPRSRSAPAGRERLGRRAGRRSGRRPRRRGSRPGRRRRTAGSATMHRRAVEVVAVGQRLAGVEPARRARRRRCRALHRDRAPHRRDRAGERDHQPVAGRPHLAAAVLRDRRAQRGEVRAAHRVGRLVAVAVEERRRADEVGEQDRDERPLHGAGASSPLRRARAHPTG